MITADAINDVNKAAGAVLNSAVAAVGPDPTEFLNTQLASALSTLGDAQYWEETISPNTIRNELSASDPSNPNSTPIISKGMKWLLASISKGRDVSDFYPHVVKLVGAHSLEARKMVYMYLVQYADHDATTRELSLLSINAFQRGLSDEEQLIRALALRVLSSIRINEILQIQILAVQKCASDTSPYVRKCAANALAKLVPRCDDMQRQMMLQLMKEELLDKDSSTMVLTSALVAFCELCPDRLELLHTSYRKICHLLTDMDEWGQVVIIDLMARYCRRFFKEPKALKQGEAALIDQERRVHRRLSGRGQTTTSSTTKRQVVNDSVELFQTATKPTNIVNTGGGFKDVVNHSGNTGSYSDNPVTRRVVAKGFYSDEEESSADEAVTIQTVSTASLMRQPPIGNASSSNVGEINVQSSNGDGNVNFDADMKNLDPDHQLLLTSSMPLLKSRNAGVVLAVCSLHYYCGVSSIKTRSAIGKALVRIHRGRREIQYVVLTSIRALVRDCPSAFAPFLSDFFVKTLDPPFTRLIKIDILVSLALEPAAIEAVLNELRAYIRHADKNFATTAIRAVGRVVELARIVYDRHGASSGRASRERQEASRIALDALHGLSVVTQVSESKVVVGEAISVMQTILLSLCTSTTLSDGSPFVLEDPNQVRAFAMRRILLLLVNSLSKRQKSYFGEIVEDSDEEEKEVSDLESLSIGLNSLALSTSIWIIGEWISNAPLFGTSDWMHGSSNKSRAKQELLRLLVACFPYMKSLEKEQAIHFASKILVSDASATTTTAESSEAATCEHILAMGRLDTNPNVKDRARFESCLLHTSIGLKFDTNGIEESPNGTSLDKNQATAILLANKPSSSYLPIEDVNSVDLKSFRFGTLSSLVGHQARGACISLPPWAKKNSPMELREPIEVAKEQLAQNFSDRRQITGFYENSDSSSEDSSDSESTSSSSGSSSTESSESDSDNSSSSSNQNGNGNGNFITNAPPTLVSTSGNIQKNDLFQPASNQETLSRPLKPTIVPSTASSSDESSESDDSSDDSSDNSEIKPISNAENFGPKEILPNSTQGVGDLLGTMSTVVAPSAPELRNTLSSSTMDDLKGLVMEPIKNNDPRIQSVDPERDSSAWSQFVRPELCGGLSVQARYLRDSTKENELRMRNIDPFNTSAVCVQLEFSNRKSSSIRRIKVLPRSGSSGNKKTLCPPEIMELKANETTNAIVIFQFAKMSDREGDIVGRIEVKQGYGGSVPIEFKPSLGELLQPPNKAMSVKEYDAAMARMQGFQRVESPYTSSKSMASIGKALMKQSSFRPIGGAEIDANKSLRMIGLLPVGKEPVMVKFEPSSNGGKIIVCCDHVVAINSILSLVKRAVSS